MEWQSIVTAGGDEDAEFLEAGFDLPKNWVMVQGNPLISYSLRSLDSKRNRLTKLVIRTSEREHFQKSRLDCGVKSLEPVFLSHATKGALCSALMALDGIELEAPLVIAPGDSFTNVPIDLIMDDFAHSRAAAATLLFKSDSPNYSYARLSRENLVTEMVEKQVVSNQASTGLFVFRTAQHFLKAATWVLKNKMSHNGEYFMSSACNYLIMAGYPVAGLQLSPDHAYTRLSSPHNVCGFEGVAWS